MSPALIFNDKSNIKSFSSLTRTDSLKLALFKMLTEFQDLLLFKVILFMKILSDRHGGSVHLMGGLLIILALIGAGYLYISYKEEKLESDMPKLRQLW